MTDGQIFLIRLGVEENPMIMAALEKTVVQPTQEASSGLISHVTFSITQNNYQHKTFLGNK